MAWTIPALLSALTLASGTPDPGAWSESMAMAMGKGGHEGIVLSLKEWNTGNPLEVDFARAVTVWKASGFAREAENVLARNFYGPLMAAFGQQSPETYSSLFEDKTVPVPAKEVLLQTLIGQYRKGDSVQAKAIHLTMERIAANVSLPATLRAGAIRGFAVRNDHKNGDLAYLPYLK